MEKPPHIAIVPSPGMGHLIPLVEFAKKLTAQHNLSATFIIPNEGPLSHSQSEFLDSLPNAINYTLLPPVNFDDLPQDAKIETRISLMVTRSVTALHATISSMMADKNVVALFVDLFGTDAFDVAVGLGVPRYLFFPAAAMTLSLCLHLPKLDQMVSCEYRDVPDPIQIPGCIPVYGKDLLDPLQDRSNDAYKWVLHNVKRYFMADGIVVNSFKGLESGAIEALQQVEPDKPPVYPVGPLIQSWSVQSNKGVNESSCLKWLDDQPSGSVLYICFGSGGSLSSEQFTELAMGLEMSEQRFIWVVRKPNDKVADATYLNSHGDEGTFDFLPKTFLERTKNRGLVVLNWAPQAQILSYSSTGGFLTHCGWNSILETIVLGVPMIAWPLYAEQKMNALMLTEGLKVAMRAKLNESGIVDRSEIVRVIKALSKGDEGKAIRVRIKELKEAALSALRKDGCSTKTLDQLVSKLINKI
ncbi:putative hydroquinone glucosyltransferase [Helianthus annuus]|uniref:Glycosyltransferase n=1 Tax=Helianthus annuus TaxID=4232 RepID=A0A251RSX0_HELAN|nr:hydroquinone glucosyltransferase [Helianthus annuus]KAF5756924.1 putative hydroquinone glucosyltransferase [Helianthus annuus]KAJ0633660.1 putative hydroquinone glucosyltransferase [Helianthus annuus]